MVEAEDDPARRGRHAPPQRRQHQQRHHPPRDSPSGSVASQSRLHNFSFPSMSWGNQRLLRCVKVESGGEFTANARGASPSPLCGRGSVADERGKVRKAHDRKAAEGEREGEEEEEEEEEDERLDKFRDAMMAEFRKAFDRIPLPPPPPPPRPSGLPPGEKKVEGEKYTAAALLAASTAEAARPWNLRLRRAACNAPAATAEYVKTRSSPLAPEKNMGAPTKYSLRSDTGPPKEERPKFSAVLSKEEIEEDFFVMTESKPPRRPKKRPRNVQKQLEGIYPGFYLTEVTPDLYKITEDK